MSITSSIKSAHHRVADKNVRQRSEDALPYSLRSFLQSINPILSTAPRKRPRIIQNPTGAGRLQCHDIMGWIPCKKMCVAFRSVTLLINPNLGERRPRLMLDGRFCLHSKVPEGLGATEGNLLGKPGVVQCISPKFIPIAIASIAARFEGKLLETNTHLRIQDQMCATKVASNCLVGCLGRTQKSERADPLLLSKMCFLTGCNQDSA